MLHRTVHGRELPGLAEEAQGSAVRAGMGIKAENLKASPVASYDQGHVSEKPVDGSHFFPFPQRGRNHLASDPCFPVFIIGEVKKFVRVRSDDEAVSGGSGQHGRGAAFQLVRQVMESGRRQFSLMKQGAGFFQRHQQEARALFRLHGCGKYFPFSRVRIGYAGYFAGDGAAFRQGVERAGLRSGFVRAVGIRPAVDVESGMDVDEAYLAGFRSDRVGGEGCIIGMGADGFAFRQGNGNGGQVPGSFVQEEDVFSVAIDKGKRAGRVQAPGPRNRRGRLEVLPFVHVRVLEEGNRDGQQEEKNAENGYNDGESSADDGFGHDAVKPQRGFCHLKAFRNGFGLSGRCGGGSIGTHDGREEKLEGRTPAGGPESCPGMCLRHGKGVFIQCS